MMESQKKRIAVDGYFFSHMWGAERKNMEVFGGALKDRH